MTSKKDPFDDPSDPGDLDDFNDESNNILMSLDFKEYSALMSLMNFAVNTLSEVIKKEENKDLLLKYTPMLDKYMNVYDKIRSYSDEIEDGPKSKYLH